MNVARRRQIGAILQARMGSTRLPGKMLREIDGRRSLLDCVIDALRTSDEDMKIVVATTSEAEDQPLAEYAKQRDIAVTRGDPRNVLLRYCQALQEHQLHACVRVCADNPLLDAELLRQLVDAFAGDNVDYAGYATAEGRPAICTASGLFAECVTADALFRLAAGNPPLKTAEHVTLGVYAHHSSKCRWLPAPSWTTHPWLRLTCDTPADLERLREIYASGPVDQPRQELVQWIANRQDLVEGMRRENAANPKPHVRVPVSSEVGR